MLGTKWISSVAQVPERAGHDWQQRTRSRDAYRKSFIWVCLNDSGLFKVALLQALEVEAASLMHLHTHASILRPSSTNCEDDVHVMRLIDFCGMSRSTERQIQLE